MNRTFRYVWYFFGIVMMVCVIFSIKIRDNFYISDYVLGKFHVQSNKIVIVLIFLVSWWICMKTLKGYRPIWLNWTKLFLSVLLLIAFVSYLI
ncbi:hypothetical protein ABNB61_00870 [Paenibacillus larvae]